MLHHQWQLSLLAFLLCIKLILCVLAHQTIVRCPEAESRALLRFKAGLHDPASRLSSWVGADCCSWAGVRCDNRTGHVVRVELQNPHPLDQAAITSSWSLTGELNPSLLDLEHLTHLDLSRNFYQSTPIPGFIGSFKKLRYLNLSRAGFVGAVPIQLGSLTALRYLDLSEYPGSSLYVDNAKLLISGLTSLQHLDMSGVSFRTAADWLQAVNMLPSLLRIRLSGCQLGSVALDLQYVNFTSLVLLDLSNNTISPVIPNWLFRLSNLEYLDLSDSRLHGLIPPSIGNLTSLKVLVLSGSLNYFESGIPRTLQNLCKLTRLDLSWLKIRLNLNELGEAFSGCIRDSLEDLNLRWTELSGYLPDWLWDLKNLNRLDLSSNSLYGPVSEGLGRLVELVHLDLSFNSLKGGVLSEAHFANLTRLQYLELSQNSLLLKFRSDWIPPFQLQTIGMTFCQLGPRFPAWLRSQTRFNYLDLSNTGISDTMPDWFWNVSFHVLYMDLSHNEISGKLPLSFEFDDGGDIYLDLGSNNFEGPLPILPSRAVVIDLSNNSLSGPIPSRPSNGETMAALEYLSLSKNNIFGIIPLFLCRSERLSAIDLSNNYLSGEIPGCWYSPSLRILDFSNNNLIGVIPKAIGSLILFESLHLRNNSLSGEFTSSLRSCTHMVTLDLGYNKLTGKIPTWVGESLANLKILSLRSNMFVGSVPPQLSRLKHLQFLDLSNNNLSGSIPREFGNFSAMMKIPPAVEQDLPGYYKENIMLVMKGRDLEYNSFLASLLTIIDLSDNTLSGIIPEELANLIGLQSLNLSGNHLTKQITVNIGRLRFLESLDLSRNQLSGEVPSSMSGLNFLTHLNLSYNNLSGRIPMGNQLQTLEDPSIYIGNPDLCGLPLKVKCRDDGQQTPQVSEDGVGGDDIAGVYASIGLGFAAGLWVVCGLLVFKERLRNDYFRFTDDMLDGLCDVLVRSPIAIIWILFLSLFVGLALIWNSKV